MRRRDGHGAALPLDLQEHGLQVGRPGPIAVGRRLGTAQGLVQLPLDLLLDICRKTKSLGLARVQHVL